MRRTARLQLRDLRTGDEAALLALLGDMNVVRYTLFPLFTPEKAAQLVASAEGARAAVPVTHVTLAITLPAEDAVVGLGGLVVNPRLETGEVWYLLAPALWGRGLMSEAAAALVRIGFEEHRLHRMWATCMPENTASLRILEKLGFRREGLEVESLPIHGAWRDCYRYAMLDREWQARDEDARGADTRP